MGHEVWIYTNEKRPKYIYGSTSLYIDVVELKPYDGLSKRFKKYTHTIQYTSLGDYKKSDYYFYIYNPNGGYYSKYILRYKHPFYKLNSVDIFFKNYDSNNNVPLILGFNHQSQVTLYFTCKHLCHLTNGWFGYYENSSFLLDGSFKESDLLTRLLEEIGPSVRRERKLVINLNQKPTGKEVKYPDSGHFKGNKITVTKEDTKDVQGFEKYVHTIDGSIRVEQFYVSYNNDSMYFENADRSGYLLESVTVYRENTGSKKPVLFELTFRSKGTSQYTYFDFVTDLKKLKTRPSEAKQIKELTLKTSDLQSTLEAERERLKQLITFVMDDGLKNENVSTQGPDNVGEGKFKKVTMRPNTDDAKEGSSVGPWRVYNTKLLTKEPSIKIQPSTLLDDITTGDTGRIENSGKKYSSITVFYTSENKALLVEFDQVGGTKTYFRRKNKEGNTWASDTGIKTSPDGQLAKTLTDIANEAQIIVDSPGDGATEVQIQTSRTGSYQGGGGQVTVEVTEEKHWDKLSKIFKRYRHAINYKDDGGVYNIALIGSGVKSEFTYENPNVRVKAVQVFFKGDAKPGKDNPLVVGFVYDKGNTSGCNGNKCYYSWTALKSTRTSTGDIVRVESISEKDLINGLLEEIGNTSGVRGRMNKLVVRISEQPNNGQATYPESAYFKDKGDRKITVTKQQVSGLTGYVGYEHSFAGVNSGLADDLYVSYGNNSRFFQTGTSAKIQNVTAYYEDDSNPVSSEKKLVLITFKLTNGSIREHKYYDFVSELKGIKDASSWSTDVKKLSGLQTLSVFIGGGSNLKTRLPEETERLRQLIAFQKGGADNQNVTTSGPNNVGSDKFIKYTMTPNKQDPDVPNKRSVGPWYVYNNKLLTKEPSIKIQPSTLLDDITTGDTGRIENSGKKYSSITVFYTSENKALLVEFDQVGGTKTYFRRKNKEGNTWAKETGISSGGVDAGKLNNIRTEAGVTTTRGTSSIQPGNGSRDAKRIDIYTNKTGTYSGDAKINVNLTEEQWDPLSKVFKVYKHAIQYPGGGSSGYNPSDYNIRVTGPGESGSQFGYTWPTKKVTEVEVFFKGTASPGNTDPLVVGFVYGDDVVHGSEDCKKSNSSKCYYSWSQLKDKDSTNAITNVDSVIEKDLVTVLLEMIGTSHNRQDKLVIRLGEQPASSSSNYPGTGKNKNEITVKKQFVSGDSRFVKYEHTFTGVTVNGVEGFYVSYEKNSRFIMTGLESMSGQVTLEKVAVYYKAAGASPGGTDKPLLIVFHFKGVVGTYEYRYSEFNEELQGLSGGSNWLGDTKIIGELTSTNAGGRSDSELISILQQESGSGSQGDSTAATVGGAVGGVAGVGGIAGIAIYKNFAAVTGLIGRLF